MYFKKFNYKYKYNAYNAYIIKNMNFFITMS